MFRTVFDATSYGVVVATENGTILFANAAANVTFAYAPDELIGEPIARLLPPSTDGESSGHWSELLNARQTAGARRTVTAVRKDGSPLQLEVGSNVVVQEQSRFVIVSVLDVTDRVTAGGRATAAGGENLNFHRLVADIAARFGAVQLATIDDAITGTLRQIGEALALDGAVVW